MDEQTQMNENKQLTLIDKGRTGRYDLNQLILIKVYCDNYKP